MNSKRENHWYSVVTTYHNHAWYIPKLSWRRFVSTIKYISGLPLGNLFWWHCIEKVPHVSNRGAGTKSISTLFRFPRLPAPAGSSLSTGSPLRDTNTPALYNCPVCPRAWSHKCSRYHGVYIDARFSDACGGRQCAVLLPNNSEECYGAHRHALKWHYIVVSVQPQLWHVNLRSSQWRP